MPDNQILATTVGLVGTLLGLLLAGVIFWTQALVSPRVIQVKKWELRIFLAYFVLGSLGLGGWLIWDGVDKMRGSMSAGELDRHLIIFTVWLILVLTGGAYVVLRTLKGKF